MRRRCCFVAVLLLLTATLHAQPVRVGLFTLLTPRQLTVTSEAGTRGSLHGGAGPSALRLTRDALTVAAGGDRIEVAGGTAGRRPGRMFVAGPGRLRVQVAGAPAREIEGTLEVLARGGVLGVVLTAQPGPLARSAALAERVPGAGPAAVLAQAVACLSYILAHRGRHAAVGFDLCDTTHCQRFAGMAADIDALAVPGEYLSFEGRPAAAYFTADCGGTLEEPAARWETGNGPCRLGSDPWCAATTAAVWERELPARVLVAAIAAAAREEAPAGCRVRTVSERNPALVAGFELEAGGRRVGADLETVSRCLRRSTGRWPIPGRRFTLEQRGETLVLRGRGRGHLAGMCQAGATAMARAGKSCRDILEFYYPGARLERLRK